MNKVEDVGRIGYAEYALGVLSSSERAEIEEEIAASASSAACVAFWENTLIDLAAGICHVSPPLYVWDEIKNAIPGFSE
jgi:anti-sigma-K factor RskA